MILVDFDRTVFDSDGFYEAVRQLLPKAINPQQWRLAYERYQRKHGHMNVFELARQEFEVTSEELASIREKAHAIASEFVYEDARHFLQKLNAGGRSYALFTFGDHDFQTFKIQASGLGEHPRIITSEPKGRHESLAQASSVIDDNPHELEGINQPGITRVRIARPGSKYSHTKPELTFDEVVTDLLDVRAVRGVV